MDSEISLGPVTRNKTPLVQLSLSRRVLVLIACVAIAAASFGIKKQFPVWAISEASADDALFVKLARSLVAGEWLGPYDSLTLARGMFYPLFIACAHALHIPLKVAEHAAYLAVAGGCVMVLRRWVRNDLFIVAIFALFAFNPIFWIASFARVIGMCLYVSLSLATFTLAAFALLRSDTRRIGPAILAGGVGGMFWITREEGLWLLPALILLLAAAAMRVWITAAAERRVSEVLRLVSTAALGLVVAASIVVAVMTMNFIRYGVFIDVEFKAPGFVAAYSAFNRVIPERPTPLVVAPQEVREKIYQVSPAAAELRASLEGANGRAWRYNGCLEAQGFPAKVDLDACPEIHASMFMWAFRDAAKAAGHYSSAPEAERYYARVAREINDACDNKRLDCFAPRHTMRPPLRGDDMWGALAVSAKMTAMLFSVDQEIVPYANTDATSLRPFLKFVGASQKRALDAPPEPYHPILRGVAFAYRFVLILGTALGLAGIVLGLSAVRRNPMLIAPLGVAISAVVAVGTRVALLSYLQATSIPGLRPSYLAPAVPFVVIVAALGTWIGWCVLREKRVLTVKSAPLFPQ